MSGKGYVAGRTTGNTTNGASARGSAGGYGGLGGGASPNPVYGDYADPDDWGSGAVGVVPPTGTQANGGGLARLQAARLILDGQLLAGGDDRRGAFWFYDGVGGSGGGIYIHVGTLSGIGKISAGGGGGNAAGAGGGRVAVYAQDFSGFNTNSISTPGGAGGGGAGTVYLKDLDDSFGTLIVAMGGGGWTPLGLPGMNHFTTTDVVVLRGSQTYVRPEHPGLVLEFQKELRIEDSARLVVDGASLVLTVPPIVRSGGLLEVTGPWTLNVPLTVTDGGRVEGTGPWTLNVPLSLTNASVTVGSALTSTVPLALSGGTLTVDHLVALDLTLTNGAVLTHSPCTAAATHKLDINVVGTITVSANSRIDVNGKGYLPGYTTGNTTNGASARGSAGSYGGLGGGASPNPVYGDYADPDDWGSGAVGVVPPTGTQANGGGLARLQAARLILDGQLLAGGDDRRGAFWFYDGVGGSGGGIYIHVGTLSGIGKISAGGGGGNAAGAGGGRVAVYAQDFSGFNTNSISAPGGAGGGGAGSIFILQGKPYTHVRSHTPAGTAIGFVDHGNGYVSQPIDSITLKSNNAIDLGTFTPAGFEITGRMGQVVPTGMTLVGDRTYRIDLPFALTENGIYHFRLLPTLKDTDGFLLDQNVNGIPGEPEDAYIFDLTVDTVPPRIVQHTPAGDVAGTIGSVDVWFSESIDKPKFTAADISILNPGNGSISVSSITEVGLNRFRISFPAQTAPGTYHVRIGPNVPDFAGNLLDQDRDGNFGETTDDVYDARFNLVPVDLQLSNVTPNTNELVAGDAASVSWQGRNTTGAPLIGNWIDAVYLSPDPFWNITDPLLGTVQHTGGLMANEVYSASVSFNVPGVLPGNYYLLVRADIGNETRETVETNNIVAIPIPVTVRQVAIGGNATGVLTAGNRSHYFAVTLAGGESLRLTLSGPSGVNQLFVNFASIPTALSPDYSGTTTGTGQTVTLTGGPSGGTYYVLVSAGQIDVGGNAYTLATETAPFFVTDVSPKRLSNGYSVLSNTSLIGTITVTGTGFDRATTVALVGTDGVGRLPTRTEFVSSSTLILDFQTSGWPGGSYNVRVTKGGITRLLAGAVTLGFGRAQFHASLVVPSALSPGYPTRQTIWIEYENTGYEAMEAPLLTVSANRNAVLTDDAATAISARTSSAEAANLRGSVQVMAPGSGGTPGILQAGDRGRIPIYYLGLRPDSGAEQLSVTLASVKAVELVDRFDINGIHFDYKLRPMDRSPAAAEAARPETLASDAWGAVWQNLTADLIVELGVYVTRLDGYMDYFASAGQRTTSVPKLFNFGVLKASAGLHPVRTLAGAVDASVPSPGFPLVFRRVYGQPMLSRYKLGPLGRGWTHNWDISVQELQKTAGVVVHGPNGVDRFFSRNSNGTYTAAAGDTGKLTVAGGLFRLAEADGTVWQFRSQNLLDYVQDPNGNRITCGYSGTLLSSLTHSSGKQLLLAYNGVGRIVGVTDPVGAGTADDRVTLYEYDGSGEHLARVTAPGNRVTTYAYQTSGAAPGLHALTRIVHPDLTENSFTYDAQGRLTETDGNCCGGAQRVTYGFDSAGGVTVTDATGRITQLFYGLGGQLAQVRDGEGRMVNFGYNDNSQLTRLLGPGGERYGYGYDGLGNLTGLEDPLRQGSAFAYEPSFNRLAQVRDARGNGLRYTYDNRGNLTAITYADNTSEGFTYDARGKVSTSTNRRGGGINYAYNAAGQLTSKDYAATAGITEFTYAYDPAGNLTGATSWNPQLAAYETINLQYETFTDRLTRIEYPGGKFFTFAYNAAGRRTRRTDQDGNITNYLYDALGRLDRMTNGPGQTIVDYDYDAAGRLSRKTLGNGVFTTYTYNDAGQVTLLVNSRADNTVLSRFAYTYDASGRRDSMTTLAGTFTYGYDPLGQLTRVTHPDGHVVAYSYDAAGNRLSVADNGTVTPYAANTLNQYSSAGAASFGYDPDGNLTNKTEAAVATTYTYDLENHLTGVATPTDNWTYTYDAFGNRVATTHNGQTTRYVIDPTGLGNVAAEYDIGGSLIARYEHGRGLLARTDAAGNPAYYTFSAIGNTSELTNSSGAVANSYSYDPFGISLGKTETIPNPFEFVGQYGVMNEGNGLEFMRARYYNGNRGRFVSEDPIGIFGGTNEYSYVLNSTVSFRDPAGLNRDDFNIDCPQCTVSGVSPDRNSLDGDSIANVIMVGGIIATLPSLGGRKLVLDIFTGLPVINDDSLGGGDEYPPIYSPPDRSDPSLSTPDEIQHRIDRNEDFPVSPPDLDPTDPQDLKKPPVVRSRDPNDKLAPVGYGSAGFIPAGGVMPYQIRFENQSSASAPAQRVTVTDTLGANFDLNTFEFTEIAFADRVIPIPAGLNHYEVRVPLTIANAFATASLVVDVKAALDVPTRTVTLTLTALDPETGWTPENPFAGLLYPEDGTGRGDGSVSYMRPAAGLTTGTVMPNRAHIVFDSNGAIDTAQVRNTIDAAAPSTQVTTLPVSISSATFPVQWTGQDDANGSGVASYDIYAAEDGGEWFPWQVATTALSADFQGRFGHGYSFYSIGRDNVGNVELPPATPDMTVRVNHNPVAGADSLGANQDRPASVSARKLLLNDSDADGDPLTLSLAGTATGQGGSVSLANGAVRYMPPPGFSGTDTFNCLVSDGLGGSGQGTVTVTVRSASAPPANGITQTLLANGHMLLKMVGIPGRTYIVQVSPDLMTWSTLTTIAAGPNGEFQFEDTDAANQPQRFYRLALP